MNLFVLLKASAIWPQALVLLVSSCFVHTAAVRATPAALPKSMACMGLPTVFLISAMCVQIAKQSLLPPSVGPDTGKIGMVSSRGEYLPAEVREERQIGASWVGGSEKPDLAAWMGNEAEKSELWSAWSFCGARTRHFCA